MCLLVSDQCADTLFSPFPKGIPILHSYLLQPRLHATFETLTPFWKYFPVSELYSNAFPCFLHRILCQILICLLTWSLSLTHTRINIRRRRIWSYLFMFISPNIVSFLEQMAHVYLLHKNTYAFQSQKKMHTHTHTHTVMGNVLITKHSPGRPNRLLHSVVLSIYPDISAMFNVSVWLWIPVILKLIIWAKLPMLMMCVNSEDSICLLILSFLSELFMTFQWENVWHLKIVSEQALIKE